MKIMTTQPLMSDRSQVTRQIANFWDKITEGWRAIWGPHIHHGYYESNASLTPLEAQEKLIEKLTEMLEITPKSKILDAGCGMGGSSLYLAKKYDATVTGITLSQKQVSIASEQARLNHINNVDFKIEDALSLKSFEDNSFDLVWSLESCEQFYDKSLFIKQAFRVLKPGGKLMLATWCTSNDAYEGKEAEKYQKLCFAFDLPYMPTILHYHSLLVSQHFDVSKVLDWSLYVEKSWNIGISLLNAYSLLKILKMSGWRGLRFASQVKLMRNGFADGMVKYGVFIATKPIST